MRSPVRQQHVAGDVVIAVSPPSPGGSKGRVCRYTHTRALFVWSHVACFDAGCFATDSSLRSFCKTPGPSKSRNIIPNMTAARECDVVERFVGKGGKPTGMRIPKDSRGKNQRLVLSAALASQPMGIQPFHGSGAPEWVDTRRPDRVWQVSRGYRF